MAEIRIISHSPDQTAALGRRIGIAAAAGQVIALVGTLGAGKTHLVRGIAHGAFIADINLVSSPTYVLLNIYPANPAVKGSKAVYHLDAYRTSGAEGFAAVGFEELLGQGGIIAIEWANRVPELLPEDHLAIDITADDDTTRIFDIAARGPESQLLLDRLQSTE